MRILIVTQWFDPEPTFKGLAFARALRDLGHDVAVLTGFPNYPGGTLYPGYRLHPWQREQIDGIEILRVWLWPSHSRSAIGRIANYLSFGFNAAVAAAFVRRPDVVYLYHPPGTAALPALLLRWARGVPFVLDIQDMWPDTLSATGMVGNSRLLAIIGQAVQQVYRAAAHIVVLSPGFAGLLRERGVPDDKVSVIPNWTYEVTTDQMAQPIAASNEFVVLYSGNAGPAQALDVVLDAAERLSDRPDIVFALMGGGIDRPRLQAAAAAQKLSNVRFLPRCSPTEAANIARGADALLIHLRDKPLFGVTIPSKTQAALRSGKPVLMGVRGDAANMVEEAGAGIAFTPESGAALAEAVLKIRGLTDEQRQQMGASGADYYQRNLSIEVGAAKFAEIFEEVRT